MAKPRNEIQPLSNSTDHQASFKKSPSISLLHTNHNYHYAEESKPRSRPQLGDSSSAYSYKPSTWAEDDSVSDGSTAFHRDVAIVRSKIKPEDEQSLRKRNIHMSNKEAKNKVTVARRQVYLVGRKVRHDTKYIQKQINKRQQALDQRRGQDQKRTYDTPSRMMTRSGDNFVTRDGYTFQRNIQPSSNGYINAPSAQSITGGKE